MGKSGGAFGEESEEFPLRHKGDEFAARRQAGEVRQHHVAPGDLRPQGFRALVRQRQELVKQTELVHQLQRGRVNGIAAEITQKIIVLLQYRHADARPG